MAIPDTMKAVQVVEYNQPYVLSTVPVPKNLDPHDLLVKVAVASFCHTDLMVLEGKFGGTKKPITGSHEGSGTVVAVGSAVAASRDFKVGDRVMCGTPRNTCGTCGECTGPESNRQYCSALEGHCGVLSVDGFFAEYARVDARWTTLLPDNVSLLAAAPLACAGRTVWRGLQQAILHASLKPKSWICVVGSGGGLGHMAVQFAVQSGLRVIGIDARPEGLAATREAGAEVVLDARDGKDANVEAVRKATGAQANGVDATLLVADVTSAAALACAVTRTHGTVVELAQPDNFTIPFPELIMRDIKLVGSCFCSPQESRDMVASITKHGIDLHTVPFQGLEKIHDLVELVHSGKIKGKAAIVVDDAQVQRDATLAGPPTTTVRYVGNELVTRSPAPSDSDSTTADPELLQQLIDSVRPELDRLERGSMDLEPGYPNDNNDKCSYASDKMATLAVFAAALDPTSNPNFTTPWSVNSTKEKLVRALR